MGGYCVKRPDKKKKKEDDIGFWDWFWGNKTEDKTVKKHVDRSREWLKYSSWMFDSRDYSALPKEEKKKKEPVDDPWGRLLAYVRPSDDDACVSTSPSRKWIAYGLLLVGFLLAIALLFALLGSTASVQGAYRGVQDGAAPPAPAVASGPAPAVASGPAPAVASGPAPAVASGHATSIPAPPSIRAAPPATVIPINLQRRP